jgi:disulfide bond formation protein DsbB
MALQVLAMHLGRIDIRFALRTLIVLVAISWLIRGRSPFAAMAYFVLTLFTVGPDIFFALWKLAVRARVLWLFPGSIGLFHHFTFWRLVHVPPL